MVAIAVVVHLALQTSMLVTRPDFTWSKFRGYFSYDQTSYLAIVVNGARGDVSFVEPFTSTGTIHYPHAYYVLLGLVARVTGLAPETTWQLVGLLLQSLVIAGLAATLIAMTGRRWPALLAPLPFVVGTFATANGPDWYTRLDLHGVLWGAYGVLFPLNGESASLCIGGLCLLALMLVAEGRVAARHRLPLAAVACLVIGALSAVQTYSFLTAVYLVVYATAAWAMVASGAIVAMLASVVLMIALPFAGPGIASRVGPLVVMVCGLVPAVPGMLILVRRTPAPTLACIVAAAIGALPQVAWTVQGVATHDPFLMYRQASTTATLSVPWRIGATAAAIPLASLAIVFVAGIAQRSASSIAWVVGAAVAWTLLAGNDRWGMLQEPYRLWIDCFTLVSIVTLPLVADALIAWWGHGGLTRAASVAAGTALVALTAAAAGDFAAFWRYGNERIAMLDYRNARGDAVASLAGPSSRVALPNGLRLGDPCIDPFLLKTRAESDVAFYNYGMAWPAREPALKRVLAAREAGTLAIEDAREADVTMVLTDARCKAAWPTRYRHALDELGRARYVADDGTTDELVLWRLRPRP